MNGKSYVRMVNPTLDATLDSSYDKIPYNDIVRINLMSLLKLKSLKSWCDRNGFNSNAFYARNGRGNLGSMSVRTLMRVCDAAHCTPNDLLLGSDGLAMASFWAAKRSRGKSRIIRSDGKVYDSMSAAAMDICGKPKLIGGISRCLRHEQRTAFGYGWRYE